MTERVQHLTVILEKEYREDDAQAIIDAIQMVRGVDRVIFGTPPKVEDLMGASTYRHEVGTAIARVAHIAGFYPSKFREIAALAEKLMERR